MSIYMIENFTFSPIGRHGAGILSKLPLIMTSKQEVRGAHRQQKSDQLLRYLISASTNAAKVLQQKKDAKQ